MEVDVFQPSSYRGTRGFTQHQVPTANATGFTAAADDYMERGIDLNEQLVSNKPATFFMKVTGSSMRNAHIHEGDIVIVDRSIKAKSGHIVIAIVDGEMLIRRLKKTQCRMQLIPESENSGVVEIGESREAIVWGVVTYVIKPV